MMTELQHRLGILYNRVGQRLTMTDPARASRTAFRRIRSRQYCLMITESPRGPAARVVQPHPPGTDEVIWLGTDPTSRKVADVERTGSCLLVYESQGSRSCVVVHCAVEVIRGRDRTTQRFMPSWSAFWPNGPDESFVALRCIPDRLEIWDALAGITPPPFGRASLHLVRGDAGWVRSSPDDPSPPG